LALFSEFAVKTCYNMTVIDKKITS